MQLAEVAHREVAANGLGFHVAEAGEGPLVLLCHGFPELWYSWRHQLPALAAAGFHAVAPDLRGYGDSDAPAAIDQYSILHLVGDLVGLVGALGHRRAHLVGHDWGAVLSWNAALTRPDVFGTVATLSVPFSPRHPERRPLASYREHADRHDLGEFYITAFQQEGRAEGDFEADVDRTLRQIMIGLDGATPDERRFRPHRPVGAPLLDDGPTPLTLPDWLTEQDLAVFVAAYRKSGFRGPLNWYRNVDRNWELTGAFQGALIRPPALYLTGERDPVRPVALRHEQRLAENVPNLTGRVVVPGAGHWVHQERPDVVNAALLEFLVPRRDLLV